MIHILFLDTDPRMCAYAHCDEDVKQIRFQYIQNCYQMHIII